jgi:hypothetical protein
MSDFSEADVRRHYDLLQHKPELGLTQLKAMVGEDIIGIGLFDNEDDFVSECRRYNGLGTLHVGINPRTKRLLDDFGGLRNRMRTLFVDVVEEGDVDFVTGFTVSKADSSDLTKAAANFSGDVSVLYEEELFFALDEPIEAPAERQPEISGRLSTWAFGAGKQAPVGLMQFARVVGAAVSRRTWFRRRTKFRKFRPYILEGVTGQIMGTTDK